MKKRARIGAGFFRRPSTFHAAKGLRCMHCRGEVFNDLGTWRHVSGSWFGRWWTGDALDENHEAMPGAVTTDETPEETPAPPPMIHEVSTWAAGDVLTWVGERSFDKRNRHIMPGVWELKTGEDAPEAVIALRGRPKVVRHLDWNELDEFVAGGYVNPGEADDSPPENALTLRDIDGATKEGFGAGGRALDLDEGAVPSGPPDAGVEAPQNERWPAGEPNDVPQHLTLDQNRRMPYHEGARRAALGTTYFHGTSSAFLPSIMSKGLTPATAGTNYGQGATEGGRVPRRSLETHGGVYLTPHEIEARGFANDAVKKHGGNPVVIVVDASGMDDPEDVILDEDVILNAVGATTGARTGASIFGSMSPWRGVTTAYARTPAGAQDTRIRGHDPQRLVHGNGGFLDFAAQYIERSNTEADGVKLLKRLNVVPGPVTTETAGEVIKAYGLHLLEQSYGKPQGTFERMRQATEALARAAGTRQVEQETVRSMNAVGFDGSPRIIGIVEEVPAERGRDTVVRYGDEAQLRPFFWNLRDKAAARAPAWAGVDGTPLDTDAGYAVLNKAATGATWLAGGCLVLAEALRRVYGGTLYTVWAPFGPDHVVLKKGRVFLDAEGAHTKQELIARMEARGTEFAELTPGIEDADFGYNEAAVENAVALLRGGAVEAPTLSYPAREVARVLEELSTGYGRELEGWYELGEALKASDVPRAVSLIGQLEASADALAGDWSAVASTKPQLARLRALLTPSAGMEQGAERGFDLGDIVYGSDYGPLEDAKDWDQAYSDDNTGEGGVGIHMGENQRKAATVPQGPWYHGGKLEGALRPLYLTKSAALAQMHGGDVAAFDIAPGAKWLDLSNAEGRWMMSMDSFGYMPGAIARAQVGGYDVVWDSEDFGRGFAQVFVVNPDVLTQTRTAGGLGKRRELRKGAVPVGSAPDGTWKAYRMDTLEACQLYGRGTRWCITGSDAYYWGDIYAGFPGGAEQTVYVVTGKSEDTPRKFAVTLWSSGNTAEVKNERDEEDSLPPEWSGAWKAIERDHAELRRKYQGPDDHTAASLRDIPVEADDDTVALRLIVDPDVGGGDLGLKVFKKDEVPEEGEPVEFLSRPFRVTFVDLPDGFLYLAPADKTAASTVYEVPPSFLEGWEYGYGDWQRREQMTSENRAAWAETQRAKLDVPIDVKVAKDGTMLFNDGHHRVFAARALKTTVKVNVEQNDMQPEIWAEFIDRVQRGYKKREINPEGYNLNKIGIPSVQALEAGRQAGLRDYALTELYQKIDHPERTAQRQPWVAVDLDGTILSEAPGMAARGEFGEPLPGAMKALRELESLGWRISIFTARFSHGQDEGALKTAIEKTLRGYGVPFTDVWVGPKPPADYFVDNKAIPFSGDWNAVLTALTAEGLEPPPSSPAGAEEHEAGTGLIDWVESGNDFGEDGMGSRRDRSLQHDPSSEQVVY